MLALCLSLVPREELDGIADGAGLPREEVRLANVFPEFFHCSGFALCGTATASGEMLHGRVLDYMTEIGLQRSAVLLVQAPHEALAFANVGYAGFAGSVTGANERGLSIGEMGGRGEGDWDGEAMAFLLRRTLEEAPDLDAALRIYKEAARTCEYFYVLAHGSTRRAVGLAAWPARLEIFAPGVAHALLPHAVPDAVLLSAGGRYEELVRRVRLGFGHFEPASALRLMDPGVAMGSNLHNALFAPESGELWVAHAPLRGGGPAARQP
jgi:isopenicillin-N N-acyltransferase-like protein